MSKQILSGSRLILGLTAAGLALNAYSQASLEEITVTARKTAQSINDVPLSITAVSGEDLERQGFMAFEEFATSVPSLSFGSGGESRGSGRTIAIRGIASGGGVNLGETTGFYIDDTPLPFAVDPKFIDVDRIEVLRGPQGTLYGARSMGGTVKIVTKKPDSTAWSGNLKATFSNTKDGDSNWGVQSVINMPLVDEVLAARVVAFRNEQGGVQDRYIPSTGVRHEDVDNEDSTGVTASLAWTPTENLEIIPNIMYQKTDSDGFPFADIEADNNVQVRAFDVAELYEDEWILPNLTVNYDLGWGKLTYSGSHFDRDFTDGEDWSEFVVLLTDAIFGVAFDQPSVIYKDQEEQVDSHEIRIATNLDGNMQFIGGVFYSEKELSRVFDATTPGYADATGTTDLLFDGGAHTVTEETALFGELSIDLSDAATLILGGRLFDSEIEVDVITGGLLGSGVPRSGSVEDDGFTPKVSLQYAVNDDAMVYGLAAKGYRLGGVNFTIPTSASCSTPADLAQYDALGAGPDFDSDSLWNYELGAKTSWLDKRLQLNAAVYYIDWEDIQQAVNVCGFNLVVNAGQAKSIGAELEITARPSDNLELGFNVSYTNAELSEDVPLIGDDGDKVKHVPDWQTSGYAEYSFPALGGIGFVRGSFAYVGEAFSTFQPELEPLRIQDAYTDVGLRLGLEVDSWEASLFADNLLDERRSFGANTSAAVEFPGRPRLGVNRPRTIGMQLKYNF